MQNPSPSTETSDIKHPTHHPSNQSASADIHTIEEKILGISK